MVPVKAVFNSISDLIAADTAYLGDAAVKHVHLITEAFVAGDLTDYAALTKATFDGYGAKNAAAGAQLSFTDPADNSRIVELIPPAGGWHWETTGVTNLPQSIVGYGVTDDADALSLGGVALETPIVLTEAGQGIDLPPIRIRIPPGILEE